MFKLTIEGDSLNQLASNLLLMAEQFNTTVPEGGDASKPSPKPRARKAAATAAAPAATASAGSELPASADDDEPFDAGDDPVEPMPETATQIVDAGTGKPVAAAPETKKMSFDDVKVACAKLVAKDQPKFIEILGKYGAQQLSGVPKDKLGDLAADVLAELE